MIPLPSGVQVWLATGVADRGAQAVIPPRKNAKPWSPTSPGAIARNEALPACGHLGRAIWKRWSGYHRRSRVETKMHCIKLLGQRLTARDFDRQATEVHVRIAIFATEPSGSGKPATVRVPQSTLERFGPDPQITISASGS